MILFSWDLGHAKRRLFHVFHAFNDSIDGNTDLLTKNCSLRVICKETVAQNDNFSLRDRGWIKTP